MTLKVNNMVNHKQKWKNGPIRNRRCTDIIFLILMIAFQGFSIYVVIYAFSEGDPSVLLQAQDIDGNRCGRNDTPAQEFPLSYIYQPLKSIRDIVCVKSCPQVVSNQKPPSVECLNGGPNFAQQVVACVDPTDFSLNLLPEEYDTFKNNNFLIYNTSSFLSRFCIPTLEDARDTATLWLRNMTLVSDVLNISQDYFEDTYEARKYIYYMVSLSFLITIIYCFVMQFVPRIIVWSSILVGLACLFLLAFWLNRESNRLEDEAVQQNTDEPGGNL